MWTPLFMYTSFIQSSLSFPFGKERRCFLAMSLIMKILRLILTRWRLFQSESHQRMLQRSKASLVWWVILSFYWKVFFIIVAPLNKFTCKDTKFIWIEDNEKASQDWHIKLIATPILTIPVPGGKLVEILMPVALDCVVFDEGSKGMVSQSYMARDTLLMIWSLQLLSLLWKFGCTIYLVKELTCILTISAWIISSNKRIWIWGNNSGWVS